MRVDGRLAISALAATTVPTSFLALSPTRAFTTAPRTGRPPSFTPLFVAHSRRSTSTSPAIDELIMEQEGDWSDVLPMEDGSHNSAKITVDDSAATNGDDPFQQSTFKARLESTIAVCRELGKSSLWIYVPMSRASLIEVMAEFGLTFHHAEGTVAVLNVWLKNSESKIPTFATHNVGVGAIVVNSRKEILCVRELRRNYFPWKTPTGLSELGERLDQAVEREVLEETGIQATFHSVLGFRQTHGLAHGRSDMYFVCRLNPVEEIDALTGEPVIPKPVPQECEIEHVAWVPLEEYRTMVAPGGDKNAEGHPMMHQVLQAFDDGRHIKRRVINSIVPGREPNAMFYPSTVNRDDEEHCRFQC